MALRCNCDDPRNTGIPQKNNGAVGLGNLIYLVPLVQDDGTVNQILETDLVNGSLPDNYIEDKVNALDPSARWYPVEGRYVNEESDRPEPNTEGFNDGSRAITTQAVRTYSVKLLGQTPHYLMNLDTLACFDLGVFIVNTCDDFHGQICRNGGGAGVDSIKPIPINTDYFDTTRAMLNQDAVAGGNMFAFDFEQTFKDSEFITLTASQLGTNDPRAAKGLIDMDGAFSSITTTGFTVEYESDFDRFGTPVLVSGGVLADFEVYNVNTASTITLTSVTPTGNSYVVVMPAQTSGDSLRVRTLIGKFFNETTISIP